MNGSLRLEVKSYFSCILSILVLWFSRELRLDAVIGCCGCKNFLCVGIGFSLSSSVSFSRSSSISSIYSSATILFHLNWLIGILTFSGWKFDETRDSHRLLIFLKLLKLLTVSTMFLVYTPSHNVHPWSFLVVLSCRRVTFSLRPWKQLWSYEELIWFNKILYYILYCWSII